MKAALWGLLPGGGHFYAGARIRGVLIFLVFFLIFGFGIYALGKYYTSSLPILSYKLFRQGKLAFAIGVPLWGLSILDAVRLSRYRNSTHKPRLTWAEIRVTLPDLTLACAFAVMAWEYHYPLFQEFRLWPSFVGWGFFEILALPVAPTLINIFLDRRPGVQAKVVGVALICGSLGGFAYAMSPVFGLSFGIFLLAKVLSILLGRVSVDEGLRAGRRALMSFLALFISIFVSTGLFFFFQGLRIGFVSPTGEFEMLMVGGVYFSVLAVMEFLSFRHRWFKLESARTS